MNEQIYEKIFELVDAYNDKNSALLDISEYVTLEDDKLIIPPECLDDIKSALRKINELENEIENFGQNQSILS